MVNANAQDKVAQSATVHLRADAVVDVRGDLLVGVMQLEVICIDVLRIDMIHDGRLHGHSDVVRGLGVGQHVELPCLHGDRRDGLHGPQDEGTSGVGKAFELAAFLDDALVGGINA